MIDKRVKKQLISILLPDLRGGGVERIRIVLAKEFIRAGYEVEFVLMKAQGELLDEARKTFSVIELSNPSLRNLHFPLVHYLRSRQPAALLAAMWPLTVMAPLMRLSGYRGRVVVTEHNMLSVQYANWGRVHRLALRTSMMLFYRLAHARAGVSAGVADDLAELSGMQRSMFAVIHNPVPPRSFPSKLSLEIVNELWAAPCGARIVSVGTLKPQKNHSLLLRAFAKIGQVDARLMFVGTGNGEADLRALAIELGIVDRVIFAGFHTDPTPFYQTADLFVLSSDYEGFGNVIVEALACGLAVVSTDCPSGPAEILENGKYGYLVPVRDPQALFLAMQEALANPQDPAILKQRAIDFAPAIAANRYLELLCH